MKQGDPQGSILGPLLYIIYTSDLPEAIHNHSISGFSSDCLDCGSLSCYADDSTYTTSGIDPDEIAADISSKYNNLAEFMANNLLVLNSDKTHLLVHTSPHRHRKFGNFGITLNTGSEIIQPQDSKQLLGATIANNFMWNLPV